MFSRITVDDSPANLLAVAASDGALHLGDDVNYWTQIFPWIVTDGARHGRRPSSRSP